MQIPFFGIPIVWGAVGRVIMIVLVAPIVASIAASIIMWLFSLLFRFFTGHWMSERDKLKKTRSMEGRMERAISYSVDRGKS